MKLTKHEKKVQLAEASAPKYGIYLDGGNVESLIAAMEQIAPLIGNIVGSDSAESTKRQALQLVKELTPSVNNATITNCSVNM